MSLEPYLSLTPGVPYSIISATNISIFLDKFLVFGDYYGKLPF